MTKKKILKTLALALSISLLAPFANKVNAKANVSQPTIVSQAGIIMDYDTNEIIYAKDAEETMYLASTTKLMTALLFAENFKKTDMITYTKTAKEQPEYSLDWNQMKPYGKTLSVGDTMSADVVMKSLLLFSGNDTAYMISDAVGGNTQNFIDMMNAKAKELGLNNTHFENPNGLPGEGGHDVNYSTAYDLAKLTKAAYENAWIRETMLLDKATVMLPHNTQVTLENRNTELGKNGNIGGKTGVTNEAGTCFAGVYEDSGKKYLAVVLKCDRNNNNTRFQDIAKMMDYSTTVDRTVYKPAGEEVEAVDLEYKLFRFFGPTKTISAPITLDEDIKLYDNSLNKEATITFNSDETNAWKIASNNEVNLKVSVKDFSTEVKGTINISTLDILKANALVYLALVLAIIIVVVLILFIIKMMNGRNRRRRSYYRRRR